MQWEQGALSGKVLTQIPNPVRNPEEDYYENDPYEKDMRYAKIKMS